MFINPISYPGNKNKLLKELIPEFPQTIDCFVDVFCGSGVVGINSSAKNVICNDISLSCTDILKYFYFNDFDKIAYDLELIINDFGLFYSHRDGRTYVEIRHEGLSKVNRDAFLRLRDSYNLNPSVEKLVVLSIYGFNHYIRFNSSGKYNVPVGKVDLSTSIYNNLKNFASGIKSKCITFTNLDFRNPELYKNKKARPKRGSFVATNARESTTTN